MDKFKIFILTIFSLFLLIQSANADMSKEDIRRLCYQIQARQKYEKALEKAKLSLKQKEETAAIKRYKYIRSMSFHQQRRMKNRKIVNDMFGPNFLK